MILVHWISKTLVLAAIQTSIVAGLPAADPEPSPPGIPSVSTAQNELMDLIVAVQGSQDGYSRGKFPHWIAQTGLDILIPLSDRSVADTLSRSCDTRDVVLKRDGSGVDQDSSCDTIKGTWYSPYDGATWTDSSGLDIDHLVPLSNAWKVRFVLTPRYHMIEHDRSY